MLDGTFVEPLDAEIGVEQDDTLVLFFTLQGLLERMSDNPMVALDRATAAAMADGPRVGLALLTALDSDARLRGHYRLDALRAHLLEMAGDPVRAIGHYRAAAERTTSGPERNYLKTEAARCTVEQRRKGQTRED